jgi:hypothetical protein
MPPLNQIREALLYDAFPTEQAEKRSIELLEKFKNGRIILG